MSSRMKHFIILTAIIFSTSAGAQVVYPTYTNWDPTWCAANPATCYAGSTIQPGDVFNSIESANALKTGYLNVLDYGNSIYNGAVNTSTTNTNTLGTQLGNSTATALGGGSTYTSGVGISAPNYSIQGKNYTSVGTAFGAVDSQMSNINQSISGLQNSIGILGSGLTSLGQRLDGVDRRAAQGIAISGAMTAAPMPSAPGKTRVKLNNAYYRGYGATSISVAHRLPTAIPAAITGGISVGYRNSAMYSGGMEVEF